MSETPEKCPLSYNPYTYCPMKFVSEDDMVLHYLSAFAADIKRLNGLSPFDISGSEEAQAFDRYLGILTAYMNGRIHELVKLIKK